MRSMLTIIFAVLFVASSRSAAGTPKPDWPLLLDRYAAGDHDVASRSMSRMSVAAFDSFSASLERAARRWASTGDASQLDQRRLQAAAFMVEVAHGSLSSVSGSAYTPVTAGDVRYRLVESACELLRSSPRSLPGEGAWYMTSFVVIALAGDERNIFGFNQDLKKPSMQISAASVPAATRALERLDPTPANAHLQHALSRAGTDSRIQAIARSHRIDFPAWPQYLSELRSQLR